MTSATETPVRSGRGGARGPRKFKDTPTDRDRVIGESLAKKVKELTDRDIDLVDVLAVKFTMSRWYEDPATKELLKNMDNELKAASIKSKKEKYEKLLKEAEAELEGLDSDDDSDDADDEDTESASHAGDDVDDEEEDDSDPFDDDDDDDKVSATF